MTQLRTQLPDSGNLIYLVLGFCGGTANDLDNLVEDEGKLVWAAGIAREFQAAIAPRKLTALESKELSLRLAAFLERQPWDDSRLLGYAQEHFAEVKKRFPNTSVMVDEFIACVPLERLRTYPDQQLDAVAENFLSWHPIIRLLAGRNFPTAERQAAEVQFGSMYAEIVRRIRKSWQHVERAYDLDDALNDAVLRVMDLLQPKPKDDSGAETSEEEAFPEEVGLARPDGQADVPPILKGYSYEGAFPAWLTTVVSSYIKGALRRKQREVSVDGDAGEEYNAGLDRVVCTSMDDDFDFQAGVLIQQLPEWRSRYLLVESFFWEKLRPRVKEIWRAMLQESVGKRIPDEELRRTIRWQTGEDVSSIALSLTIRRLRQRLDALEFVRNLRYSLPPENVDEAGDVSLIAYVNGRRTLAETDIPTIRHLGALGRAVDPQDSLEWAILTRHLIDLHAPVDEVVQAIGAPLLATDKRGTANILLQQARDWISLPQNKMAITSLERLAKAARVGFLLSPCWYLSILRQKTVVDILEILRPAAKQGGRDEGAIVTMFVDTIGGADER